VPLIVRSWALGVDAEAADTIALARDHTRWSDLFETAAGERLSGYLSDPSAGNLVQLPAQIVWDSLFLDAGGRHGLDADTENAVAVRTAAQFAALVNQNPAAFNALDEARTLIGRRAATIVTDGAGGANCLSTIQIENPSWVAVCPSGTAPVAGLRYSILAIKHATSAQEEAAWEFAKHLLSAPVMVDFCMRYRLTPIRESVARQIADDDARVFIRQVRNMVLPGPGTDESGRRAARDEAISTILGARTNDSAVAGEDWVHE
jgi:ABC-type glycerol-3-phosphate transport system substrate-binding protein